ncbi:MAG: protein kinase [Sandaracinaceae bacterium]
MSDETEDRVAHLVREGRHAEAADLCVANQEYARAAELYAAVWRWDEAIAVTEEHGLYELAYRYALSGGDRTAAARVLGALEERPEQAVRAALFAESKGALLDAARLREAAGETAAAAALYERAGELRDAARCWISQGDLRKAGRLLEKRVQTDPDDAASALELGRILAQFGRWDHAIRALQHAARSEGEEAAALRLMVACFAAMGMDEAASSRLDALRKLEPELPRSVPEMLEQTYGDSRGVAGLVGHADSDRLLAGRYRVMRPLGAGGTGRVVLAHDAFYDREVAIKILTVGGGAVGRDAFVRFSREARVAAGIEHPNVVRIFEFNPDGPFLVMEYMSGGTLEERLMGEDERPRPLEPTRVWAMIKSVLEALEAVHRRGIVHRDLKPANVFYDAGGQVKLGDFGVAHLTDLGATLTGAMVGTLAYMAPEQITGSQRPNAATDLYALGCIIYRCLTGRLPLEGPDFVAQHLELTPPLASDVAPWLGAGFDDVLARLLMKTTEERFDSASSALDALRALPWSAIELPDHLTRPSHVPARPSSAPSAEDSAERYIVQRTLSAGRTLARDELLERDVELAELDEVLAERLRGFARADGPFLQAVYEIDEHLLRAVLEHPSGQPMSRIRAGDPRRASAIAEVRLALRRLHGEGVTHGALSEETILIGSTRACLLLSSAPQAHDPEIDWRALDAIGGRASNEPGR